MTCKKKATTLLTREKDNTLFNHVGSVTGETFDEDQGPADCMHQKVVQGNMILSNYPKGRNSSGGQ